jgi:cobalt transporter subunit CbtB
MGYKFEHAKKMGLRNRVLSLPAQLTAIAFLVGIVLYTALFSGYPPAHDTLHEIRHALMFIPCH